MRKRGPKNNVEKQPKELVLQINQWLLEGKLKLEDIADLINEHPLNGIPVSISSLNRYQKVFDREMKDKADIDHLISNLPDNFSFNKESKLHAFIAQMLQNKLWVSMAGKEDIDAKDLSFLAKSLKDIMSSTKDREKIREQIEKEVKEKTLKTVEQVAIKAGISKKGINLIKEALKD